MFAKSAMNRNFQVNWQQRFSTRIRSFWLWLVPEIRDDQLCISNGNFSNNNTITNLKQASLRTLQYKECLPKEFSTKRTRRSRQQRFSKRIRSFRSWLKHEIRDHQLCISDHNFSNNNSTTNLKQASLRTLQYKECVLKKFEMKRTRSSSTSWWHYW